MKRNIEVFTTILLFMLVSSILTISSAAVCSHVWDEKVTVKTEIVMP